MNYKKRFLLVRIVPNPVKPYLQLTGRYNISGKSIPVIGQAIIDKKFYFVDISPNAKELTNVK